MTERRSTFWRRFWLLEKPSTWSRSRLRRLPELAHIPPDDPYFARSARVRRFLRHWLPLLAALLVGEVAYILLFGSLARLVAAALTPRMSTNPIGFRPWIIAYWCVVVVLTYGVCYAATLRMGHILRRRSNTRFRTELRRRGIPVCLKCGYEAGAMSAPNCPECGNAHTAP